MKVSAFHLSRQLATECLSSQETFLSSESWQGRERFILMDISPKIWRRRSETGFHCINKPSTPSQTVCGGPLGKKLRKSLKKSLSITITQENKSFWISRSSSRRMLEAAYSVSCEVFLRNPWPIRRADTVSSLSMRPRLKVIVMRGNFHCNSILSCLTNFKTRPLTLHREIFF